MALNHWLLKQKCSYVKAFVYQLLVTQQKAGQQEATMKVG